MSDLIINGIDHSKFEPEWAKRGGVVLTYFCGAKSIQNWTQFGIIGLDSEGIEAAQPHKPNDFKFELIVDQLKLNGGSIRMATPDECAEAGIEYIEPPARWLPINTLTTDIPVPLIVCDKKSKERGVLTGENIFGGACISGWNDDNITPTHWMPLPQPPKDE